MHWDSLAAQLDISAETPPIWLDYARTSVADPRIQRRSFTLAVERRFAPGDYSIERLFTFPTTAGTLGVHIDAVGTTVNLGCPQIDQFHEVGPKTHFFS